jgi:hypothetical protein
MGTENNRYTTLVSSEASFSPISWLAHIPASNICNCKHWFFQAALAVSAVADETPSVPNFASGPVAS